MHHKLCISTKAGAAKANEENSFEDVDEEQTDDKSEKERERQDDSSETSKEKSHGKKLNELAKKLNDSNRLNQEIDMYLKENKEDDSIVECENELAEENFDEVNTENNDSVNNKPASNDSDHNSAKKQEHSPVSLALSRSPSPTISNNEKV